MDGPLSFWRAVESLLNYLDADIEPSHGGRLRITQNKVEAFLHHPYNNIFSKDDIKTIREMF